MIEDVIEETKPPGAVVEEGEMNAPATVEVGEEGKEETKQQEVALEECSTHCDSG